MAANKTSLSAGIVVRAMLLESAEVRAITEEIFPVVKSSVELPYVFYRRTALEGLPTKDGPSDTVGMELLCCAASYDESLELAEAVRAALDCRSGEAEGLRMRSCYLADSEEAWESDAYIQQLTFTIKIT